MFEATYISLSFAQLLSIQRAYENGMIPIDRVYYVFHDFPVSERKLKKIRKLMIKFIKMYFGGEIDINSEIYLKKSNYRIVKSKYSTQVLGKNKEERLVPNVIFQYRTTKRSAYEHLIILLG